MIILFDIDHTLVKGSAVHLAAFTAAVKEVCGVESSLDEIDYHGTSDEHIGRLLLRKHGVPEPEIDARLPEYRAAVVAYYVSHPETPQALPGVQQLLEWLHGRAALGLGTGNYEQVAREKLRRAGLPDVFAFGGFGNDSEDRAELLRIAFERGAAAGGTGKRVVIGDTPKDIAAGHANGATVIAVATGSYGVDELRAAEHVVASAAEIRPVLEQLQ